MTTVAAREMYVTVNGIRLRYLDWGSEGKIPNNPVIFDCVRIIRVQAPRRLPPHKRRPACGLA